MNKNNSARKVISQIRHACDGKPLRHPVRALAMPRRVRASACEAAQAEAHHLRREARLQGMAMALLGTVTILFVAALVIATLSDATGSAPKLNQGLAAIGRFMGGLFS